MDACHAYEYHGARVAPVAQLDRVLPSEGRGRGFESRLVHHSQNEKASGRKVWGFFVGAIPYPRHWGHETCRRLPTITWAAGCRVAALCTTLAGRRSRSTPREPVPIPDGRCLRVSDAVLLSGEDGGHCRVVQMIQGSFDQQVHTVGHTVDGQGYGAARAVHLGGERADRQQVLRGVGEQAVRSGTRSARP